MAQKPTAGWNVHYNGTATGNIIGALIDWDDAHEGDTEDVSGTGDVENGIVRRIGKPVDKGEMFTCSLILDEAATEHDDFVADMENRIADSVIYLLDDSLDGFAYTGHAESFNRTGSRSESVWKASLTFYVNSRADVTAGV